LSKIRKAKNLQEHDWPRMIEAIEQMRGLPLYIAEQASPNINQIRAKARLLRRKYGLDKLTIDYIGLTSGTNPKEPRHQQLGEVTRGLKGLAKELNIPIIALAQLSRGLEQRTNGRPMLSDLKDSGDIEQDADVVIFIDRPYHTNNDLGQQWEHYAELIVAKHRNGATGSINARYVGGNVQFLNWDGAKPEKLGAKRTGSNL
jgi:replicative DNA helicase